MNEVLTKENVKIENLIYEIHGQQVMLDSDLAKLYGTETKRINEAVSRNPDKFPKRYCFKISENEYNTLKSHVATSKGGSRKGHTAFAEQGIAMLATILKTPMATQISIAIMDAFVVMKKYISSNLIEQKYINNMVFEHDKSIQLLQESFNQLEDRRKVNEIYFNGQIYDAYSKIVDIFKSAKKELIIIDGYCDKNLLDMIRQLKINIVLITKDNGKLSKMDIEKYNQQYRNLTVIYNNTFHDRYFIIDNQTLYHCGTSIHHVGNRTFSINILDDDTVKKALFDNVKEIQYSSKNFENISSIG